MTMFHHQSTESLTSLAATLGHYTDAGIDPAFDSEMEELERQFAEIRVTFDRN